MRVDIPQVFPIFQDNTNRGYAASQGFAYCIASSQAGGKAYIEDAAGRIFRTVNGPCFQYIHVRPAEGDNDFYNTRTETRKKC